MVSETSRSDPPNYARSKLAPRLNGDGAAEARGADNSEVTGSSPVLRILVFIRFTAWYRHFFPFAVVLRRHVCFTEIGRHSASDVKLERINLFSSAAERRAHNPGVDGSKPSGGTK